MDTRKLLAEGIGTFILVGMGSMAILAVGAIPGSPALVVIPFGFGLGLLAAIAVSGHVSGGHFNPAVTLGALLDGRIDVKGALAHLMTRPARPRYQERTMESIFVSQDEVFARANEDRRHATAERLGTFARELAECTAGSIQIMRAPAVLCSLLALALGISALLR